MPLYGFRCEYHGEHERSFPMGQAPASTLCTVCWHGARRVFGVPQFQEDRARFWSRNGSRYSSALGCDLPESRSAIAALAKEKGVELDAHEMPHVKRAAEIGRAVREGVKVESKEAYRHIAEPREPAPTLAETLRRSGKMRAVSERIAVGYENWSDRGAMSEAEMTRKGAEAIGAGASILNSGKPV